MNQLEFSVTGNQLEISQDAVSTSGSISYDSCAFTFDSEWNGFERTAVFGIGRDVYRVAIDQNNTCVIPSPCTEKEGLITIAVLGVKNSTVIATNPVAHRIQNGVENSAEWIEEDYSLVQSTIDSLTQRVNSYIDELDEDFDELISTVEGGNNSLKVAADSVNADDWYTPNAFTGASDLRTIVTGGSIDSFYNYKLTALCSAYPNYVTCEQIGTDASGEYPIKAYTFEPENYEKTILVTGGAHGSEAMVLFGLSHFFDLLCRDTSGNRALLYLKKRVKFVVVPAINPYALAERCLDNSNSVDIGRNFPYKWNDCTSTTKGTSAADQAETQAIIELVEGLASDKLCAAVDCHVGMYAVSGKSIYYPRFKDNCITALSNFINRFNYEVDDTTKQKSILAPSILPTLSNYLSDEYGINTCEMVWPYQLYGGQYDNGNYTKMTEFIANLLLTVAKNSDVACKCGASPFTKYISWCGSNDSFAIPASSSVTKMGISNYSLVLSSPCVINMNGFVVVDVTTACTVKINPILYQVNSPEQSYDDRKGATPFVQEYALSVGTHVIPISSVLQAYSTSYNDSSRVYFCENVGFVLGVSASAASCAEVTAFSVSLSGIPSDLGKAVEVTSPIGNCADYSANDVPTQQVRYPLESYIFTDSKYDD